MSQYVTLYATINIRFDRSAAKVLKKIEIKEAIASAVSECSQIEDVASVVGTRLTDSRNRKSRRS
jgi:hypothetical protein